MRCAFVILALVISTPAWAQTAIPPSVPLADEAAAPAPPIATHAPAPLFRPTDKLVAIAISASVPDPEPVQGTLTEPGQ
jgi:hypothetical protein